MRVIALSEIATIRGGGRLGLSGKDFVKSGYPAYGAGGMNGYVATADHEGPAIILSSIGARCGKCFLVDGKWTSLANTQVIFPNPAVADTSFLWYQLNDENSWHRSGTGQPFIKPSDVKGRLVKLPSLEEQRRIAAILDQADAVRAKRRRVLAQLDALPAALFHRTFGSMVRGVRWHTAPLGEIAQTRLGKMLDAKNQSGLHSRPYLRNANVQWFRFELDDLLTMDFDARDRAALALREGDVIVCEGGQPGRSAVWRAPIEECYYQKALHRVRVGDRLRPDYLAHVMRALVSEGGLNDFISTATIAHLTGERLRLLPIPLPPVDLQRSFESRLGMVQRLRDRVEDGQAGEDALFRVLQARAFRGEL